MPLQRQEEGQLFHTEMCDHDRSCNRMVQDCRSAQCNSRLHSQRPRDNVAVRCPWPTEMRMDKGGEFAGEVSEALKEQCRTRRKVITTCNPQANSMVERIHQVIGDMMRTRNICGSEDLDKDFGWSGVLAAVPHSQLNGPHDQLHNPNTTGVQPRCHAQHLLQD